MASKTLLVAQREYLENIRTKTFWIGIFIVPVLIAASIGIGRLINEFKGVQKYAVVNLADTRLDQRVEREFRSRDVKAMFKLAAKVKEEFDDENGDPELKALLEQVKEGEPPTVELQLKMWEWLQRQPPAELASYAGIGRSKRYEFVPLADLDLEELDPPEQRKALNKLVGEDKLFAFFVLGENPLETYEDFTYVSNNLTDNGLLNGYQRALTTLLRGDRIRDAKISKKVAQHIQQDVELKKKKVDEKGEEAKVEKTDTANQWAPIGFVYLLFVSVFSIANLLLTNTIEEKSNRIIEVLLSSVSPAQLMHGKIYGIAFTGMTMVGTWVIFALLASWIAPSLLGEGGGGEMISFLIAVIGNSSYLASFVLYFLGGFLLYAAVLVAIGSVCNTLKEAQNLMQPVIMILMVPLIAMVFVTQEPNGLVAKVLSFIPLFTPFTMMNRAAGPPETWEYVATSIILVATIWFAFKAAGKIFRVGVLMTGNPPKLKEIFSWLRQS